LLRPSIVDDLCAQCGGIGVVKGSPEEEQAFERQRQRNSGERQRIAAVEKARRQEPRRQESRNDNMIEPKRPESLDEIPSLIELIEHGDEEERQRTVVALWNTKDPRAVPPLLIALNDPSWEVKFRAIKAFRYVPNDQAILPLIQVLKTEKNIALKAEAATTLAWLGAKGAIDALRDIAANNDNADTLTSGGVRFHDVINNALKSLGELPTVQHPSDLEGTSKEVALSLKSWYRDRAISWWRNNKERQSGVCDDGNEPLRPGEGFLRPGNYLCCELHTDSFLCDSDWDRALRNLEGYFGPGLPDHIKLLARRPAEGTADKG
jgi:hypothetical protein